MKSCETIESPELATPLSLGQTHLSRIEAPSNLLSRDRATSGSKKGIHLSSRKMSVLIAKNTVLCEQVNVLTGRSISIDELANILMEEMAVNSEKEYNVLPEGDPKGSRGTIEKIQSLLKIDLNNMISIKNGLSKTVKFIAGS